MNKLLLILIPAMLVACGKKAEPEPIATQFDKCAGIVRMSNADIISETKVCEGAGLSAQALYTQECHGSMVTFIQCLPK